MKKLLLLSLLAFGLNAKAQITLEHIYDSASTLASGSPAFQDQLMIVNFDVSGERYVRVNRHGRNINIYDLNHSLVQSISFANAPYNTSGQVGILYLSEKLFDLDPEIEFMYIASNNFTGIYNHDGSLLFSDTCAAWIMINVHLQQYPIYNTSQGTKMILSCTGTEAKVYNLPGILTLSIQEGNNQLLAQSSISNAYPNPVINSTRIDYTFPAGVNEGEIVFYDLQGKEVKRYKVDKTFDHLLISTSDIPAGTYLYQLQTTAQTSAGKKMVVIK